MMERRREKFLNVIKQRQPDLTVVIENIHDPHNVSAILRTADAVGLLEVQLVYTNEEFPALGKKSSASAIKWIKRNKYSSIPECYNELRQRGFHIYATKLGKRSRTLFDIDFTEKVAFVFGNEHQGVSAKAAELSDGNFQIPMTGMIESLNVSVACAVTLYEAFRQRRKTGYVQKLSDDEIKKLFMEWTKK
jgi:tRNA (guanosine-2'-O-)-methyltransferase